MVTDIVKMSSAVFAAPTDIFTRDEIIFAAVPTKAIVLASILLSAFMLLLAFTGNVIPSFPDTSFSMSPSPRPLLAASF